MKPSVLDVLIYLFEHYIDEEMEYTLDRENVRSDLWRLGIDGQQVDKAFDWLEVLASQPQRMASISPGQSDSMRIYTRREMDRLSCECRGFLHLLEQAGVLDPSTRETIIDQVMALEVEEIDIDKLKWIVLLILFNQPGNEHAFNLMEDLVMDDFSEMH